MNHLIAEILGMFVLSIFDTSMRRLKKPLLFEVWHINKLERIKSITVHIMHYSSTLWYYITAFITQNWETDLARCKFEAIYANLLF